MSSKQAENTQDPTSTDPPQIQRSSIRIRLIHPIQMCLEKLRYDRHQQLHQLATKFFFEIPEDALGQQSDTFLEMVWTKHQIFHLNNVIRNIFSLPATFLLKEDLEDRSVVIPYFNSLTEEIKQNVIAMWIVHFQRDYEQRHRQLATQPAEANDIVALIQEEAQKDLYQKFSKINAQTWTYNPKQYKELMEQRPTLIALDPFVAVLLPQEDK